MNINDLTVDDVHAMSAEEKAALNKAIARKFGKKILTQLAVAAVTCAAINFAVSRMDKSNETDNVMNPTD